MELRGDLESEAANQRSWSWTTFVLIWIGLGLSAVVWFAWAGVWFVLVKSIGEQDAGDRSVSIATFVVDPIALVVTAALLIRGRRFAWRAALTLLLAWAITVGPIAIH